MSLHSMRVQIMLVWPINTGFEILEQNMFGDLFLVIFEILKSGSFHDANFVVTGGTTVCRNDHLRYHPAMTTKLASRRLALFNDRQT